MRLTDYYDQEISALGCRLSAYTDYGYAPELQEIARYCAGHIENYEIRVQLALDIMDRSRCPLYMADRALDDEIRECAGEWAEDHDNAVDFFDDIDTKEILFAEV